MRRTFVRFEGPADVTERMEMAHRLLTESGAAAVQFSGAGYGVEWSFTPTRPRNYRRGIHPNARRRPKVRRR